MSKKKTTKKKSTKKKSAKKKPTKIIDKDTLTTEQTRQSDLPRYFRTQR